MKHAIIHADLAYRNILTYINMTDNHTLRTISAANSDNVTTLQPADITSDTMDGYIHDIIGVMYLLTGIVGISGHAVLISGLKTYIPANLQKRTLLHISMAVANIGIVVGFPLTAPSCFLRRWVPGAFGCQFYGFIGMLFGLTSIFHLMLIAVDMYHHRPFALTVPKNQNYYYLQIIFAWLGGLFWAIMPLFGWASYAEDPSHHSCTLNWQVVNASYTSYLLAVTFSCYTVPFSVMAYCILVTIKERQKADKMGENVNNFERKYLILVISLLLLYLAMWTPYAVLCLNSLFDDPGDVTVLLSSLPPLAAKIGSCFIPFMYKTIGAILGSTGSNASVSSTIINSHVRTD